MYDKLNRKFVVGEELSIEEYIKFGRLDRDYLKPKNLTRDERVMLKYCYAIMNSLYYIEDAKGEYFIWKENNEIKKAMFDMYVYTLNKQATSSHLFTDQTITIKESAFMPGLLGGYDQDVIEFALLQQGYRILSNTDAFRDVLAYRIKYGSTYALKQCKPVSIRELADSIEQKIKEAKEEMELE